MQIDLKLGVFIQNNGYSTKAPALALETGEGINQVHYLSYEGGICKWYKEEGVSEGLEPGQFAPNGTELPEVPEVPEVPKG